MLLQQRVGIRYEARHTLCIEEAICRWGCCNQFHINLAQHSLAPSADHLCECLESGTLNDSGQSITPLSLRPPPADLSQSARSSLSTIQSNSCCLAVTTSSLQAVLTLLADAKALWKGRARFRYAVDIVKRPPGWASRSISAVRASSCAHTVCLMIVRSQGIYCYTAQTSRMNLTCLTPALPSCTMGMMHVSCLPFSATWLPAAEGPQLGTGSCLCRDLRLGTACPAAQLLSGLTRWVTCSGRSAAAMCCSF